MHIRYLFRTDLVRLQFAVSVNCGSLSYCLSLPIQLLDVGTYDRRLYMFGSTENGSVNNNKIPDENPFGSK